MKEKHKKLVKEWGPKSVPIIGYIITIGMILGALGLLMGSAFFLVLFDDWIIAGFGFLGAVILGGQGALGFVRQLERNFCTQTVTFHQT